MSAEIGETTPERPEESELLPPDPAIDGEHGGAPIEEMALLRVVEPVHLGQYPVSVDPMQRQLPELVTLVVGNADGVDEVAEMVTLGGGHHTVGPDGRHADLEDQRSDRRCGCRAALVRMHDTRATLV